MPGIAAISNFRSLLPAIPRIDPAGEPSLPSSPTGTTADSE
jgi:hypothetical protein